MGNTLSFCSTIVAQSSMILDEFAFEKNFCCFLDNNYTDTTCNKETMQAKKVSKSYKKLKIYPSWEIGASYTE